MARWTLAVIRHRKAIIAAWIALFLVGGAAAANLGDLLSNRFSVPGSDAERGLTLLKDHMHERSDGAFTLVVQGQGAPARSRRRSPPRRSAAARAIEGGRAGAIQQASPTVAYVQISTPLENQDASKQTPKLRKAIGDDSRRDDLPDRLSRAQPRHAADLQQGPEQGRVDRRPGRDPRAWRSCSARSAGSSCRSSSRSSASPRRSASCGSSPTTMDMAIYVTNIVTLIGFAIAIDYSMLVVFRYREELELHDDPHAALVKTMTTAGRATLFSGLTVAVGLGLLIFMPAAVHALDGRGRRARPDRLDHRLGHLPAGLPGRDGTRREPLPRDPAPGPRAPRGAGRHRRMAPLRDGDHAPAVRCGAASRPSVLIALALAATDLHLTGGDNRGIPITTEAARGLKIMEDTLGPGALAPQQVVIDTHRPDGVYDPAVVAAQRRLVAQLRRDPEVVPKTVLAPFLVPRAVARQANLVDDAGRVGQIRAAGHSDAGEAPAVALVHRIRDRYIPAARFPASTDVLLTGAPAFGVDFIDKSYGAFPWLVLAVLVHLLPAAAARLPLGLPAAQGRDHEPAVGERDLRAADARVRARLGQGDRAAELAADRGVDPDLPLRRALRPVDGLRGLPALAHARGVGPAPRQRARRRLRPRAHRAASSPPARSS